MRYFEGCYVRKQIKSGDMFEISVFQAPIGRQHRGLRTNIRNTEKQSKNRRAAVRKLARIINANFSKRDEAIVLTYDDLALLEKGMPEGLSQEEAREYRHHAADKQLRLFCDRLRKLCKKAGVNLRYVAVTSDIDGETGQPVRIHHHVIISGEASAFAERAWRKRGYVLCQGLQVSTDNFPLAYYMLAQVGHEWNAKSYIASRNLQKPQETYSIVSSLDLPDPPAGAHVYEHTSRSMVYAL